MKPKIESTNLDFLRSIAVLFVVSRHVLGELNFGRIGFIEVQLLGILGVLMFFVHTSLVLMFSFERQRKKLGTSNAYQIFLIRRFFRIYPLSMFVVALVFVLSYVWPSGPLVDTFGVWQGIANFFLFQNLVHATSIIGPLWSLPIELQMYLLLPLFFPIATQSKVGRLLLIVWPISVALSVVQYKLNIQMLEVLRFAPCFIPGIICYALRDKTRVAPGFVMPLLLAVCFVLFMVLGAKSQSFGAYPVCLLLGLALPFIKDIQSEVVNAGSKIIARYSYSIYLWHSIVLSVAFYFTPNWPLGMRLLVFAIPTCVISFLTYHLIEEPMIVWGNKVVAHRFRLQVESAAPERPSSEPAPVP